MKTATDNHRFIFSNHLAYFTPQEIEDHYTILDFIEKERTALLLGYPATGKSFSVVDIAERLAIKGYKTYYFSFKKIQYWPEIWEELKNNADPKIVFVLDDVHLQPETAGATLNRLRHDKDLNILFISREVYKNRNFADTINIYKEFGQKAIRTEQPSIDEKVKGIVQFYQKHYQKEDPTAYPTGDFEQIIKNAHRNLIVLNAYLNLWQKNPQKKLADLQKEELYKDIYATYFEQFKIDEDNRIPLLQYLCIYYFEVEFYRNPSEKETTKELVTNAAIIKEENDLYAIYHGEYAFLLLKAFRFVKKKRFKGLGNNWQTFFYKQIKAYIQGFTVSSDEDYPENLLEILGAIPRFTKDVEGGIKNTKGIFKLLVEDRELQSTILSCCEAEEIDQNIAFFLFSILENAPNQFELYYKAFGANSFNNDYAIGIYTSAYKVLSKQDNIRWFIDYCQPNILIIIENSYFGRLGDSLNSLNKNFPVEANFLYAEVKNLDFISKLKKGKINEIGNALNELKNIDAEKTRTIFQTMDNPTFLKLIENARIHEIGNALNELKNIDAEKTRTIFQTIDNPTFLKLIENARIHEIGNALNALKNIDAEKTRTIFQTMDNPTFLKLIEHGRINEIGNALNALKNIDAEKTRTIFQKIDNSTFFKLIENARIHEIGTALNELKNIDAEKTRTIFQKIDNSTFFKLIENARIHEIGQALNELKNIDAEKTRTIFQTIDNPTFLKLIENARINEIGNALNELKNIDAEKTRTIFQTMDNPTFLKLIENARINEIGNALNELKNIDAEKTRTIFQTIDNNIFFQKIKNARIHEIGQALNALKNIDPDKTEIIAEHSKEDIYKKILKFQLNYRLQIEVLNYLGRISSKMGIEIYQMIPKEKLYQFDNLRNIFAFNLLAHYLFEININKTDKYFRKLASHGLNNCSRFLKFNKINVVSVYINSMHKLELNISNQLKKNINLFTTQLLKEEHQKNTPRLIANIFMHNQNMAINQLLLSFQVKYPNDCITVGSTYIEIASNNLTMDNHKFGIDFLKKAKKQLEETDAPRLQEKILHLTTKYNLSI